MSERDLAPGEHIQLQMRTHIKAMFGAIGIFLVTCALFGFAFALVPDGDSQGWLRLAVGIVALIVIGRFTAWPFLNWLTSTITITNERLMTSNGVFTKYGDNMPLARLNNVSFEHGVIDRMFGCGTLIVSNASDVGLVKLPDVPHVHDVQRILYELIDAEADRARSTQPGEAPEIR